LEAVWVQTVEQRRRQLLTDRSEVAVTDYGSGSSFGNGRRRVCDIARHSSTSPRDGRLLCNLASAVHSANILELGTNLGIGSLYLVHSANCSRLVTIEGCPNLSKMAADGFNLLGVNNITLINAEFSDALPKALESLPSIDFVFIDAAKGQYGVYLEKIMSHAHKGSVIVCDNILFDGNILESKYAVERRDRTIHKRLRDFIYGMCHDERFTTAILSVGDGLLLSVVK
jgi:predicted O-methyltransferase YrrM